jgi:hypothetical protein
MTALFSPEAGGRLRSLLTVCLALAVWCGPARLAPAAEEPDIDKILAELQAKLKKAEAELAVQQAENRKLRDELAVLQQDHARQQALLKDLTEKLRREAETARAAEARAKQERDRAEDARRKAEEARRQTEEEVKRILLDANKARDMLVAELRRNQELTRELAQQREQSIALAIQVELLRERNIRLEKQLQETIRELERLKGRVPEQGAERADPKPVAAQAVALTGAGVGNSGLLLLGPAVVAAAESRPLPRRNPPANDVEGMVLQVDEGSGLIKISVGSDAGLVRGQTLEVYRLSRTPGQSKYLGTVRLTDVGPKDAIAQPVGRMTDRLRPGDMVTSRIAP